MRKRDFPPVHPKMHRGARHVQRAYISRSASKHLLVVLLLPTYMMRELQDSFFPTFLRAILNNYELTDMSAFCFPKNSHCLTQGESSKHAYIVRISKTELPSVSSKYPRRRPCARSADCCWYELGESLRYTRI